MDAAITLANKFGFEARQIDGRLAVEFPEGELLVEQTPSGWVTLQGQFDDIELAYQHFSREFSKLWQAHVVAEINQRMASS